MLLIAVALHLGVAVVMGLWLFSAAMLVSHMAFAPASWLRWFRVGEDTCGADQRGGFVALRGTGSSSSNTRIEGQRAPGSTDSPRASAR